MTENIHQNEMPSVAIHISKVGKVQITFAGAVCSMDSISEEAVLTIAATQLIDLKKAVNDFVADQGL